MARWGKPENRVSLGFHLTQPDFPVPPRKTQTNPPGDSCFGLGRAYGGTFLGCLNMFYANRTIRWVRVKDGSKQMEGQQNDRGLSQKKNIPVCLLLGTHHTVDSEQSASEPTVFNHKARKKRDATWAPTCSSRCNLSYSTKTMVDSGQC